jgi:hypothetical protein
VDDGADVGPNLVGFSVDKSLHETVATIGIDWIRVEVVFHDVLRGHQRRSNRARHQISIWIGWMADADVP